MKPGGSFSADPCYEGILGTPSSKSLLSKHQLGHFSIKDWGLSEGPSQDTQTAYLPSHTVDGRNPAIQLRLVVYPMIYQVLYIPGGAGFLPSTVSRQIFCPQKLQVDNVSKKRDLYTPGTLKPTIF